MIKLDKVTKIYYSKGIVATGFSKVSLDLELGEFVVVVGESGSGKSTLLNVISGLDTYEEGEMYVNGKETSHFGEDERNQYRKKYIANIFQAFNLINAYTVKQNVELALILNGYKRRDIKPRVNQVLKDVGLWKLRRRRVTKLSGGQKQRVAIARALVQETPIIVCDEPTGNLDSRGARDIFKLLKEVAKDKLVIVVTHNFDQVSDYATRVIRMHDGEIVEDNKVAPKEEVIKNYDNIDKNKTKFLSRVLLAFRNAFSTLIRFCLCTAIFMIAAFIFLAETGSFESDVDERQQLGIANWTFPYSLPERIVVNKKDLSAFTEEDINKIKALPKVKEVIEEDIMLDRTIPIQIQDEYYYLEIDGLIHKLSELDYDHVSYGTKPEEDNEILIVSGPYEYFIRDDENRENLLNGNLKILDPVTWGEKEQVKVTGILIDENYELDHATFYVSDKYYDIMNNYIRGIYDLFTFRTNNYDIPEYYFYLRTDDKVPEGGAFVSENLLEYCKDFNCNKQTLTVKNTNKYFEKKINVKIKKTYNYQNYKSVFGVKPTDDINYSLIYINPNDYEKLLSKENYQISVIAENKYDVEELYQNILDLGNYHPLPIKLTYNYEEDLYLVLNFVKLVVTAITLIVIFIISYLLVYLILKSRSSYYAVIRMLGGTKGDNRSLVYLELVIYAIFSFTIVTAISYIAKYNIISIGFINRYMLYLDYEHFIALFVILIVMSLLIAFRFAKKIFKDSMINTYNMEV